MNLTEVIQAALQWNHAFKSVQWKDSYAYMNPMRQFKVIDPNGERAFITSLDSLQDEYELHREQPFHGPYGRWSIERARLVIRAEYAKCGSVIPNPKLEECLAKLLVDVSANRSFYFNG